jgi:hypothetical protein
MKHIRRRKEAMPGQAKHTNRRLNKIWAMNKDCSEADPFPDNHYSQPMPFFKGRLPEANIFLLSGKSCNPVNIVDFSCASASLREKLF